MRGWGWIAGGVALGLLALGARRMLWPVEGRITSRFGELRSYGPHNGIDIAAPVGTPIVAPASGEVTSVFTSEDGGNSVLMKFDGMPLRAGFAHLKDVLVNVGQRLSRGEVLGTVGMTGHTTGPHLHFTFKDTDTGEWINPEILLA